MNALAELSLADLAVLVEELTRRCQDLSAADGYAACNATLRRLRAELQRRVLETAESVEAEGKAA